MKLSEVAEMVMNRLDGDRKEAESWAFEFIGAQDDAYAEDCKRYMEILGADAVAMEWILHLLSHVGPDERTIGRLFEKVYAVSALQARAAAIQPDPRRIVVEQMVQEIQEYLMDNIDSFVDEEPIMDGDGTMYRCRVMVSVQHLDEIKD